MKSPIGLYEKAIPLQVPLTQKLTLCQQLGFDYLQLSIDENPHRLQRLAWDRSQRQQLVNFLFAHKIRIQSLCVSANRQYPLGSPTDSIRRQGRNILQKAIDLAADLGARNILISGYDVFQAPKTILTRENYLESLQICADYAAQQEVMLSIETMDDSFAKNISVIQKLISQIASPWLKIYLDLGNLTAWEENNVGSEIERGIGQITEIHFKDARYVSRDGKGQFRNVPYGQGDVDFDGCMKLLHRLNYQGPWVIERWAQVHEPYQEQIITAKNFLLSYLNRYFSN